MFCRCRYDNRVQCSFDFPSDHEIKQSNGGKKMKFDRVFNINSTQEEVNDYNAIPSPQFLSISLSPFSPHLISFVFLSLSHTHTHTHTHTRL